jgi:hypothetical protein
MLTSSNPTRASLTGANASSLAFNRLAGLSGGLAGLSGLLYAVTFLIVQNTLWSSLFLLINGLSSIIVLVGLYGLVVEVEPTFARLGLILAVIGGAGATIHGGYDLANSLHPASAALPQAVADLPSQTDPRGLLTFGLTGLGLVVLAWLVGRSAQFPKSLSYLGFALAGLLVELYLARLIILDAKNLLIAVPALLTGFLLGPIWNFWLGLKLWRSS